MVAGLCSYRKRMQGMNKVELELLELEALLEASENVAEQLRLADYGLLSDTVLELCRRLRAGKNVFSAISEAENVLVTDLGVSVEDWEQVVLGDYGV